MRIALFVRRLFLFTLYILGIAFTGLTLGQTQTEMFLLRMPEGFKLGWQKGAWAE